MNRLQIYSKYVVLNNFSYYQCSWVVNTLFLLKNVKKSVKN